jgi:opacity protein-like surface antigen
MTAEVIPLCVSVLVTLPVGSTFKVNLLAGGGYYFGRFKAKSSIEVLPPERNSRVFTPFNFQGNGNTAGFHAGGGVDIPLYRKIFLSVEAIYSSVKFKNVKSDSPVGEDTTFTFQQWIKNVELINLFDYRVSQIDLSGLTLRAGIKFQF